MTREKLEKVTTTVITCTCVVLLCMSIPGGASAFASCNAGSHRIVGLTVDVAASSSYDSGQDHISALVLGGGTVYMTAPRPYTAVFDLNGTFRVSRVIVQNKNGNGKRALRNCVIYGHEGAYWNQSQRYLVCAVSCWEAVHHLLCYCKLILLLATAQLHRHVPDR